MLHTHKSVYDRSLEKTREQVFIDSLRKEFELSPAENQGVLLFAPHLPKPRGRCTDHLFIPN